MTYILIQFITHTHTHTTTPYTIHLTHTRAHDRGRHGGHGRADCGLRARGQDLHAHEVRPGPSLNTCVCMHRGMVLFWGGEEREKGKGGAVT